MSETQVCELTRWGRGVKVTTPLEDLSKIFDAEISEDYSIVIIECLNHIQPAWYFEAENEFADEIIDVEFTDLGKKTFREQLVEGYQEKAVEDAEIAEEFSWASVKIFEHEDPER